MVIEKEMLGRPGKLPHNVIRERQVEPNVGAEVWKTLSNKCFLTSVMGMVSADSCLPNAPAVCRESLESSWRPG
jgi:hypothetical protein